MREYDEVHFWPQMCGDLEYLRSLVRDPDLNLVGPALSAFDALLQGTDCDYIGTRLHGGIRALQHGRRSLILSVDNRAVEIGRDTGLPVVPREDTLAIGAWIDSRRPTTIALPNANIARWKAQFGEHR